jgi:hypothetical protein
MDQVKQWRARCIFVAVLLLMLAAGCVIMPGNAFALYLVKAQDMPVLVMLSFSILATAFWPPSWALPRHFPRWWMLLLAGLVLAALLVWGTYAIMGNYPLSRDEDMVLFDMAVYDRARLAVPLAPQWRPYAHALVPAFLLNDQMPIGLVSGYLPVNSLVRLAFSKIADPAWYNPLLVIAGGAALLDIARRTFGPDDRACWVVLLIYALSAQMLANAMTPFSMTGHMALNLIWLAAFLRGGKWGHTAAILTAFLAIGLHQLVFHPMFAAPFLLWRLREGQWRIVLIYAAAYAAIVGWWAYFPMLASAQAAQAAGQASEDNILTEKLLPLIVNHDPAAFALMILNLMRFCAWQNFAMLPLFAAAIPVARRERGLARAMLLGIVIWLIFLTLVIPRQGNGWGFRYLHGYLGSFALLAGYGYRELERHLHRKADGLVLLLSGVTAVAAIPLLFVGAYRYVEPHVALDRFVASQPGPMVVIDDQETPSIDRKWAMNPVDQVRNLPDLSNRPLRFSSYHLSAAMLAELCRRGPVTLITRADQHRQGFGLNVPERSPEFAKLVAAADRQVPGCFRKAVYAGQPRG